MLSSSSSSSCKRVWQIAMILLSTLSNLVKWVLVFSEALNNTSECCALQSAHNHFNFRIGLFVHVAFCHSDTTHHHVFYAWTHAHILMGRSYLYVATHQTWCIFTIQRTKKWMKKAHKCNTNISFALWQLSIVYWTHLMCFWSFHKTKCKLFIQQIIDFNTNALKCFIPIQKKIKNSKFVKIANKFTFKLVMCRWRHLKCYRQFKLNPKVKLKFQLVDTFLKLLKPQVLFGRGQKYFNFGTEKYFNDSLYM